MTSCLTCLLNCTHSLLIPASPTCPGRWGRWTRWNGHRDLLDWSWPSYQQRTTESCKRSRLRCRPCWKNVVNEPDINGREPGIARTIEQQREPAEQEHNIRAIKVRIHMPACRKKEHCNQACAKEGCRAKKHSKKCSQTDGNLT